MNTFSRFILYTDPTPPQPRARDCDCACASSLPAEIPFTLSPETPLQLYPTHTSLPLSDDYHIVFAPSFSGIGVANPATCALLESFRDTRCLATLNHPERQMAERLCALNLLRPVGNLPEPATTSKELIAWLHITNACNLRCTYCYIRKDETAMASTTAFAAVDAIARAAQQHGYESVRLKYAGGEATLNLPTLLAVHTYAQKTMQAVGLQLSAAVLSNGVHLSVSALKSLYDLEIELMISLDGPEAYHDAQRPRLGGSGSYQAVLATIERAKAVGILLTISITVTGASVDGLPTLIQWLLARDLHFTLNFYRECDASQSRAELQWDEERLIAGLRAVYQCMADSPPRYSVLGTLLDRTNLSGSHLRPCGVGQDYLVIDQYGKVAKCQMEIANSVTSIWDVDPLSIIRLDQIGVQNVSVQDKEGCRTCEWRYWCAGGCPVATYRATGRYDVKSPNCNIYKALYPALIRLEGQRILHWATHQPT